MIDGILRWFEQNCDGDWEHQFGFTMETTDNPGLSVSLDIGENEELIPDVDREILSVEETDGTRLHLKVESGMLVGYADMAAVKRLLQVIDVFLLPQMGTEAE